MDVGLGREPAWPVYAQILRRISHTRTHGSTRQRFNVDTWQPAVQAHHPDGPLIGDPCRKCGHPWPCAFLQNLLKSGLIAE